MAKKIINFIKLNPLTDAMHKKRAVISTILVILISIALVIIISKFNDFRNSGILLVALKEMRSDPDKGFGLCGQLTIQDYANDCYATYLSVEIERTRAKYLGYENLTGQERKDAVISFLNEVTEKTDRACSISFMEKGNECAQVNAVIEQQRRNVMSS